MASFLLRILINAVALWLIAGSSSGAIKLQGPVGPVTAILVALVLGVANATVKPFLLWFAKSVTCALSCLTLGLWSLVVSALVNGFLFYAVQFIVSGFKVKTFWPTAVVAALILAVVNAIATSLLKDDDKRDTRYVQR